MKISYSILAALVFWTGCHEHSHEEPHGHEHHPDGLDIPGISVTIWTERTELFMEHPPLIAGEETRFAAHLTVLPSFKALSQGTVTITIDLEDGTKLEGRADQSSSPGIFRPVITPLKPGRGEMKIKIVSPALNDEFKIGAYSIYEDRTDAFAESEDEVEIPGRITYLKEQAWKTEFANAPATERELLDSVSATGELRPAAGREAQLTATASGRVQLGDPIPVIGMAVKKGQLLATLAPRLSSTTDRATLDSELSAARAAARAADLQTARADRLFAEQAISEKALDEAKAAAAVSRARLEAAQLRLEQWNAGASGSSGPSGANLQIRSPIAGTLVMSNASTGASVEQGALLFTVIDLERVWLEARVFEPDIPKVEGARAAWFRIEGHAEPFAIDEKNGKLITVGHVIDPASRTVPVVFEVENSGHKLRIGQYAKINIAIGAPKRVLSIPETALLEDAGRSIVFVQVEGESFERRPVSTGIRDRGFVEIREGVNAGERVVTKGAYEVKLASASGSIPAHGHAH